MKAEFIPKGEDMIDDYGNLIDMEIDYPNIKIGLDESYVAMAYDEAVSKLLEQNIISKTIWLDWKNGAFERRE